MSTATVARPTAADALTRAYKLADYLHDTVEPLVDAAWLMNDVEAINVWQEVESRTIRQIIALVPDYFGPPAQNWQPVATVDHALGY